MIRAWLWVVLVGLLCSASANARGDQPEGAGGEQDPRAEGPSGLSLDPCERRPEQAADAPGLGTCPRRGSSGGVARGDFNADGFADLAVGVPSENVGTVSDAGVVHVIYGSSGGLTAGATGIPAAQVFSQNSASVDDSSESNDNFGAALASGDFNADGFSDLAIGVPGESNASGTRAGVVQIIYGTSTGLNPAPASPIPADQLWPYSTFRSGDRSNSRFGSALVWGDFNGDRAGDLAIGIPNASVRHCGGICFGDSPQTSAGEVLVLFGGTSGIGTLGFQLVHQTGDQEPSAQNFGEVAERDDRFGSVLAAGDLLGNDLIDDLAIGITSEDLFLPNIGLFPTDAGMVQVLRGSGAGLLRTGFQLLVQGVSGADVLEVPETGDRFGAALAVGDFDGGGLADLAIGVPGEDLAGVLDAGSVNVYSGSGGSLSGVASPIWQQGSTAGLADGRGTGDEFGASLAAGDFDADGRRDLAVGVPRENLPDPNRVIQQDAGAVHVIYGSAGGLTSSGDQFFTQASLGPTRHVEAFDFFGSTLSAWNFGRNDVRFLPLPLVFRTADLAIGVPGEDLFDAQALLIPDAGAVNVLYGDSSARLNTTNNQLWRQNIVGVTTPTENSAGDSAEASDGFGRALY